MKKIILLFVIIVSTLIFSQASFAYCWDASMSGPSLVFKKTFGTYTSMLGILDCGAGVEVTELNIKMTYKKPGANWEFETTAPSRVVNFNKRGWYIVRARFNGSVWIYKPSEVEHPIDNHKVHKRVYACNRGIECL